MPGVSVLACAVGEHPVHGIKVSLIGKLETKIDDTIVTKSKQFCGDKLAILLKSEQIWVFFSLFDFKSKSAA